MLIGTFTYTGRDYTVLAISGSLKKREITGSRRINACFALIFLCSNIGFDIAADHKTAGSARQRILSSVTAKAASGEQSSHMCSFA